MDLLCVRNSPIMVVFVLFLMLIVEQLLWGPRSCICRTIENDSDSAMTIMVRLLCQCSAKLANYRSIEGAFFPKPSWVSPSCYLLRGCFHCVISELL